MNAPKSKAEADAREAWASWSEQSEPGTDWQSFWAGWRARAHAHEIATERTVQLSAVIASVEEWREWASTEYGVPVRKGTFSVTGKRLDEILSAADLSEETR